MKEYRVVEGSSNLEYQINKAARDGFRPILMVANGEAGHGVDGEGVDRTRGGQVAGKSCDCHPVDIGYFGV